MEFDNVVGVNITYFERIKEKIVLSLHFWFSFLIFFLQFSFGFLFVHKAEVLG